MEGPRVDVLLLPVQVAVADVIVLVTVAAKKTNYLTFVVNLYA